MDKVLISKDDLRDLLEIKKKWMTFIYVMYQLKDWRDSDFESCDTKDELRLWGLDFDENTSEWVNEQIEKLTSED